jgi:hypothetical protein
MQSPTNLAFFTSRFDFTLCSLSQFLHYLLFLSSSIRSCLLQPTGLLTFLKCCRWLHLITSQSNTSNFRRYDKTNTDIHIIQTSNFRRYDKTNTDIHIIQTSNFRRYDKTNTDMHIIQTDMCTKNILIIFYIPWALLKLNKIININ